MTYFTHLGWAGYYTGVGLAHRSSTLPPPMLIGWRNSKVAWKYQWTEYKRLPSNYIYQLHYFPPIVQYINNPTENRIGILLITSWILFFFYKTNYYISLLPFLKVMSIHQGSKSPTPKLLINSVRGITHFE